jgi:hypothetical protein
MNSKIEYGLEGAFKVDLFSGEKFHSTTDWFSNFITPTGLLYPLNYSFADCFRYLSIGYSSHAHTGSTVVGNAGTTGLSAPVLSYRTSLGTNQRGTHIGWEGYATGLRNSNCGTTLTEAGPRFYRAWYVPTGNEEVYVNVDGADGLNLQEFMVSPSSGSDPTGKYAFSRVTRNLYIPNGFRAIVSYQLKVNIRNTGATILSGGAFQTGNAEVSNDFDIVKTWSSLSGYYRQVYFGLRCVDNLGFTYIPKFGDGMEPASRNVSKMVWYLSPDNGQFDVNGSGGGVSNVSKAYKADGLCYHVGRNETAIDFKNIVTQTTEGVDYDTLNSTYNETNLSPLANFPTDTINSNIRLGWASQSLAVPEISNYKFTDQIGELNYQVKATNMDTRSISYATPGYRGFSDFHTDFGKIAAFTSNTTKLPFNTGGQNAITGRKKTVTRKSVFSPVAALGYNTRFGSLVYAYEANNEDVGARLYWPMIDCLFYDTSGQATMPHYRYVTGIYLSERGTGVLGANIFLSGKDNSSIYRFNTRKTFQGGYNPSLLHAGFSGVVWQRIDESEIVVDSGVAALKASGAISSNVVGQTGAIKIGANTYTDGWGAVYGLVVDSGYYDYRPDLGLMKHDIYNLQDSPTGRLFWPHALEGFNLNLHVTGLKYYDPAITGVVIEDNNAWFGSNQVIKDVNFDVLTNGYAPIVSTSYVKNVTGQPVNFASGFFLTKTRYYNSPVVANDIVRTASASTFAFTGYAIPNAFNSASQYKGSVWDDAGKLPTVFLRFNPLTTTTTISGFTDVRKVTGLFTGVTDRGFTNGTGGTPIADNDKLLVFFTGFSGTNPLYLTMYSGQGNTLYGFSYLTGTVSLTNFRAPTGYVVHSENSGDSGWRLAPLHAPANYYGADIQAATAGGEYPALSMDNGLEMYLDISWSSPCGPSVQGGTCNEPI